MVAAGADPAGTHIAAPRLRAFSVRSLHDVRELFFGDGVSKIWRLIKDTISAWVADYAPSMGAALSYYTIFSIAPLLIIVIAVAGIVFGQDAAHGAIMDQLSGLLGQNGAQAIESLLRSTSSPKGSLISTIIGVVTLLIGATTVFGELQDDLNRIWKAPAKQGSSGLWSLLRTRILSFGMILAIGFLLLVSLVLSAAIAGVAKVWGGWFGSQELLLHAFNFVISLALVTVFFALIYKIMPNVRVAWRDVWIGSLVTAVLFTVGKTLIGLYLGKAGVAGGYGAAGSLIVALLWTYYAAQIFLLGAEFSSLYARRYGSLKGAAEHTGRQAGELAGGERAARPSDAVRTEPSAALDERAPDTASTLSPAAPGERAPAAPSRPAVRPVAGVAAARPLSAVGAAGVRQAAPLPRPAILSVLSLLATVGIAVTATVRTLRRN